MAVLDKGVWYPSKEPSELSVIDSFIPPEEAEAGRYHLFMSYACPFAHRPYLVINYLGLEDAVSISSVAPERDDTGWLFNEEYPNPYSNAKGLVELHQQACSSYSGKVTVPILWDKREGKVVGNDSATMAMDFATKWLPLAKTPCDLVPTQLKGKITARNVWLHENVNRKVYIVGFAKDQSNYDVATNELFSALEELDLTLGRTPFLHGEELTLSDLFLVPTLVRFEAIYEVHFKANKKPLIEFENLYRYMLNLVADSRIRETIDVEHMKLHYYFSHRHINPYGIIPAGPKLSW